MEHKEMQRGDLGPITWPKDRFQKNLTSVEETHKGVMVYTFDASVGEDSIIRTPVKFSLIVGKNDPLNPHLTLPTVEQPVEDVSSVLENPGPSLPIGREESGD